MKLKYGNNKNLDRNMIIIHYNESLNYKMCRVRGVVLMG